MNAIDAGPLLVAMAGMALLGLKVMLYWYGVRILAALARRLDK